ncbi:nuclear transport factor 2 family protein [Planobispora longispora]|uniref:SnoaL-like domain-containing protein n=1 Tax=Planobispora longispora TaxID=28887 RepID=A0A8J3RG67_9ACTN|nr:nuclear transport factor 2 family protein [Planobispora longispora]GIH75112.1 hypothetical protein Plo01_15410 [Planobispora longispora]
MLDHPNNLLARESYDALAKGDVAHIRDNLLADDVVFHVPGGGPLAGEYRGKDEVAGYLTRLVELAGGALRMEPESFLVDEEHSAALLRIRGERDGRVLDERGVQVFRFRDDKIVERWSYPPDPRSGDEFFA